MLTVNIHQAKTNLSHYLNLVQKGQKVVIAKRNVPIAEITPVNKIKPKRRLGQSRVKFEVPENFFAPLPHSVIKAFNQPK